jgi:hypothetical protein
MQTPSRSVPELSRNPAATFGREVLKIGPVENCGKKLPGYSFGRMARHLWPQKTPASIEFYTDAPERSARQYAADKSDPGSVLLAQVIDSDQGWRAIEWIMRDSKQKWWKQVKLARKYEEIRTQLEMSLEP